MQNLIINGCIPLDGGWSMWIVLILCAVFSYLLGSLSFSAWLYKTEKGKAAKKYAVMAFLADALKGAVAALAGLLLFPLDWIAYVCAFFCLLGHAFPVFFRFRGRQYLSCPAGAAAVLNPIVFAILAVIWFITVMLTKYMSLSAVISAVLFAVLNMKIPFYSPAHSFATKTIVTVLIPVVFLILYRSNIVRMAAGTEPKVFVVRDEKNDNGFLQS